MAGRPSKYKPEFVELARKVAKLGATEQEVAEVLGVSKSTLNNWKGEHPEFLDSLNVGREQADARVTEALFHRAVGFRHNAVKILQHQGKPIVVPFVEQVAPDTTACIFWPCANCASSLRCSVMSSA